MDSGALGLGCRWAGLGLGLRMGPSLGPAGLGLGLRRAFREPQRTRTNEAATPIRRRIRPRRVRTRGSSPVVRRAGRWTGTGLGLGLGLGRGRRPSRVSPGCDTCSVRWCSLPCRGRTLHRGRRRRLGVPRARRVRRVWARVETENRGTPPQVRSRVPRDSQGAARRPRPLLRRARSGCPRRNWRSGYSRLASGVRSGWKNRAETYRETCVGR